MIVLRLSIRKVAAASGKIISGMAQTKTTIMAGTKMVQSTSGTFVWAVLLYAGWVAHRIIIMLREAAQVSTVPCELINSPVCERQS